MITHIYFDWSGTLAKSKSKEILLSGTLQEKKATLFPDTLDILRYLYKKGYILGIISNTKKNPDQLIKALKDIGVYKYFKGNISFSNATTCKKPCKGIFLDTIKKDNVDPENSVMIGNNYKKDILGASRVGMYTSLVDREHKCIAGKEDIHIHNLCELKFYL